VIHVHLDAVGGAAGDMFIAAMLGAFPHLRNAAMAEARAVLPEAAGRPVLNPGDSNGIAVLRFGLEGGGHHHHPHDHGDHHHDEAHDHHHHEAHATSYRALCARIAEAPLSEGTRGQALALLQRLARVEAAIHQVSIDEVHFHELADWDSLVDVVAAASIIAALPEATWSVSDLPVGSGLVKTQHGQLPVPAPATLALLEGFAWRDDGVGGERVTPTGAAIISHLVKPGAVRPAGRLVSVGTGAGTRTLAAMPNVLRAVVFDAAAASADERVAVISFEVDDMSGEEIAVAAERLRGEPGALDVTFDMRWGKKGRAVHGFRLLTTLDARDAVISRCLIETSTIGLRHHEEARVVLPRVAEKVGSVGLKRVTRPDGSTSTKAENDDLDGASLAERRLKKMQAEHDV